MPDDPGRPQEPRESPDGPPAPSEISRTDALEAVLPVVYRELRRLAAHYLQGERPDHTLQATALVHEAYLRLLREQHTAWQNRAHFCAIAAGAMRQILVEHARARNAQKRGGHAARITLDEALVAAPLGSIDVEALHDALEELARLDRRQARLVELRFFGGLSIEEAAGQLAISPATAKRDWTVARAWLKRWLTESGAP
ncbi:MAG: sigma-70 family RNA polymerase sigma factor [Luteitalea sp.]|nr:sigma-70 family RNA polymerase sigma factor [Luteitalea sp.]